MPRCICCDDLLTDSDMMMDLPNGQMEDTCHVCRGIAFDDSPEQKEHSFAEITNLYFFDGITRAKLCEY